MLNHLGESDIDGHYTSNLDIYCRTGLSSPIVETSITFCVLRDMNTIHREMDMQREMEEEYRMQEFDQYGWDSDMLY